MFKEKINWKRLAISVFAAVGVGVVSALATRGGMDGYKGLSQPFFAPPGFLFPIVWTILFILMGISAYLVYQADAPVEAKSRMLKIYIAQLVVNFLWSIIFFNFRAYFVAFVWLLLLLTLIIVMIRGFYKIDKKAGLIQIPYLLWVAFAGVLNYAIYLLN